MFINAFINNCLLVNFNKIYIIFSIIIRFINISQQQYGITTDIPTLESFKAFQERKRKIVNERIQEFSKKCRENIREGFQACLDALKKCQNSNQGEDEFAKKNENQNQYRLKESAYDQLGFPDNMSYEQRSELRKECSRFLRFSYIIDFIAMESLVNVYRDSVLELLEGFEDLVNQKDMTIIKDKVYFFFFYLQFYLFLNFFFFFYFSYN